MESLTPFTYYDFIAPFSFLIQRSSPSSFMSTRLSIQILISLSAAAGMALLPVQSFAQSGGEGTVIIEQKNTEYQGMKRLGKWGLATPVGVIEGESERIEIKKKPTGNYILTVTPPAGALSTIEVFENDVLKETFNQKKTANGKLTISGGTLRFTVTYAFTLIGHVAVTSDPPGVNFELRGPDGFIAKGKTPINFPDSVAGTYTNYYLLPKECRKFLPVSRKLEPNGRVGFSAVFDCAALGGGPRPTPTPAPKPTPPPPAPAPAPRPSTQSPVRVSLNVASSEVTAGGTARYTLVVLNRGEDDLKDLTAEFRFDASQITIVSARDTERSGNMLRYTIASLPKDGKWEASITATVNDSVTNGTNVSATVTVSGDDIKDVRASQRSDSAIFGVIKELPQTGVAFLLPFELIAILALACTSLYSVVLAGVQVMIGR